MYQNIFYDKSNKILHIWDDKLGYFTKKYEPYAYKKSKSGQYTSIYNNKLKKIQGQELLKLKYSNSNIQLFESDIKPETRFLIDNYTENSEKSEQNICFYDIEVNWQSKKEWELAKKLAEDEITSITFWLSKYNKYFVLIWDPDNKLNNIQKLDDNTLIQTFEYEKDLLKASVNFIAKSKITVLSGWNSENFDDIYFIARVKRILGEEWIKKISPIELYNYYDKKNKYTFAGFSLIDYLEVYKNFTYSEKPSYSLDSVGKDEIEMKKLNYDGSLINLFWTDRLTYLKYNVQDVKIMVALENKKSYMDIFISIAHIGHIRYEEALSSLRVVDGAILTYMKKHNIVAPDLGKNTKEKLVGGFVKIPTPGRKEWIYDLDFSSLYPSIIKTLNMSVETKVGKVENWRNSKDNDILHFFDDDIKKSEIKEFLRKSEYSISKHGIIFDMKKSGVIPTVVGDWLNIRKTHKDLKKKFSKEGKNELSSKYDKSQHAYKILANSLYGVIANEYFRFYDIDIANSITVTGQHAIKYAAKETNKFYINETNIKDDYVIYIDTDSIMASTKPLMEVIFKNVWKENPLKYSKIICKTVEENVNNKMINFVKDELCIETYKYSNYLKLKQEWICDAGLFVAAKKRYGLHKVDEDGIAKDEMEIKGLEIVRSSYPVLFQNFLTDILKKILDNINKKEIDKFIVDFKNKIEKEKDIYEISNPTGVKGVRKYSNGTLMNYGKGAPVHVKSAIHFNQWITKNNLNYKKIDDNNKIKWIYLIKKKTGYDTIAFPSDNLPEKLEKFIKPYIDFDKLFEGIDKKVMKFYEAMKWNEIVNIENTFEGFFG